MADDDAPARDPSRSRPSLRSLSGRQRALLLGAIVGLPLLLFAGVEVVLRVAGYGSDYPLFVPVEAAPDFRVPNPDGARLYFRHEAGLPTPPADLFRARKTPGTFRVVVQGASTVAGFPFRHGGAFPRMLEQRLQETFPDRTIEVVNTALDATNSYTLADRVEEIVEIEPDAVLIYAGHNEYYGVLGAASAESVGRIPGLVRLYLGLRKLRTVQLIQDGIEGVAGLWWKIVGPPDASRRTLMEYLAADHTVTYGSDRYHAGVRQFEENLGSLLDRYEDAGVPVYLGTLASNLRDLEPFRGGPRENVDTAGWGQTLQAARTALAEADPDGARTALDRLLAMDSTAALPHFLLGRLLERTGDTAGARDAYTAARDRDRLPFRAPSPINRIIRRMTDRPGVRLVDTESALAAASPGNTVDGTHLLEHVHPTVHGQFLLADAFFRALLDHEAPTTINHPVPFDSARSRVPVTAVDSVAGYITVRTLMSGFPFQPTGAPSPPTPRPDGPVGAMALAYQQGRVPWADALRSLAEYYSRQGQWSRVAHVHRALGQELAYGVEPMLVAAQAALLAGEERAALRDVAEARRRLPTARGAWLEGNLYARQGDTTAAREAYLRARRLSPRDARVTASLQALDTLPALEAAVEGEPDDPGHQAALAAAYFAMGRYEAAARAADRALQLSPGHPLAAQVRRQLGAIYRNARE